MINSVIFTQAYNAQNTIKRTIESILNQSRTDFEYYILDNGSIDDTESIILEYAKIDKRIKPVHINKNDITNGGAIWNTILWATSAKYTVWCDADDEYTLDFLENMVQFSEENQLDIVSCGYEKIDGQTNNVITHRALSENLIIHGNLFVDEFIKYRGFTVYTWGKLYSIPFLKSRKFLGTERKNHVCNDSISGLRRFKAADRVGVYGKAMYKYYQYPRSLSRQKVEDNLSSYSELWHETKKYLEHYGVVSKLNEDFLYAIHMSLVDEAVGVVFASELPTYVKLNCLLKIFNDPIWSETMARDADPQFRNLAARKEYVRSVRDRVSALPDAAAHNVIINDIFHRLVLI